MDNCLTFALRMWRYIRTHDELTIRRSHWGWFPHFAVLMEMADGTVVKMEYVPLYPRPRWLPPVFFKGAVRKTFYRKEAELIE